MTDRHPRGGLLVALEGIDGVGKSTLQRALARRWRAEGLRVSCRREPGHPELAAAALERSERDPWSAAMFFTIDRWRMRSEVDRLLGSNDVLLLDRSFYSTLAYQGSRLGPVDRRRLDQLQHRVAREPDRVIWLRLPVADALKRVGDRGSGRTPVERVRTLRRVARAYASLAGRGHWIVLDARDSPARLVEQVDRALTPVRRRRGRLARGRA